MLATVVILLVGCFLICVAVFGLRYFTGARPASVVVGSHAPRTGARHGSKR